MLLGYIYIRARYVQISIFKVLTARWPITNSSTMGLMVLLMKTGAACIIFVCVLFIDMNLLVMLYLWGVPLSSVSFSAMIMSIGLSIDYNIHIAHAFLHGKGDTVEARTRYTLDSMGGSVLKGGFTTLAGTIILSNASSPSSASSSRFASGL